MEIPRPVYSADAHDAKKIVRTKKINIKANNIKLKQPAQHFCEENSVVNIIFTLLLCFSYRKLEMGQFESL